MGNTQTSKLMNELRLAAKYHNLNNTVSTYTTKNTDTQQLLMYDVLEEKNHNIINEENDKTALFQSMKLLNNFNYVSSNGTFFEYLLYGLVRQKEPSDYYINSDIIDLCLSFYSFGNSWDLQTSDSRLVIDNKTFTIAKTSPYDMARYYAFSEEQITMRQKRVWRMKITKSQYKTDTYEPSMSIGIIECSKIAKINICHKNTMATAENTAKNGCVTNKLDCLYEKTRYKLFANSGNISDGNKCLRTYCDPIRVDDEIKMELDLTDLKNGGKLRFEINGKNCGIAWKNIDVHKMYSLCVAINRTETLQIL